MHKINPITPDVTSHNIAKIAEILPQVATELVDAQGNITRGIDFDLLRQHLSGSIIEGPDERYRLDWPGKRRSILKANTPITKTLRPDRLSSVDFDTTQNVYIEGDNFEVLKILQESYLGQVKMIYIDPPYNTGRDFVYRDNFRVSRDEYEDELGVEDEDGGKLFRNTDTNGRFHSDWLSMMYERLIVARDLLRDDGVIFMSIDDNEVHNLRKVCDEIFGEGNLIGNFLWNKSQNPPSLSKTIRHKYEYVLSYMKKDLINGLNGGTTSGGDSPIFNGGNNLSELLFKAGVVSFHLDDGVYKLGKRDFIELLDDVVVKNNVNQNDFRLRGQFRWTQETLDSEIQEGTSIVIKSDRFAPRYSRPGDRIITPSDVISMAENNVDTNERGRKELEALNLSEYFDFPKPTSLIKYVVNMAMSQDYEGTILDFFSGSATTAHAVMQLNAEDGGNRKHIMVQVGEETTEGSAARSAGYNTIADIGRERIRRAAEKIKIDFADKLAERATPLDTGFRSYVVADSIMGNVFQHPLQTDQATLFDIASENIKPDRTPEDILTAVMLNLGLTLDLSIDRVTVGQATVFNVANGALVACFDVDIDFAVVEHIAGLMPIRAVFRDASFANDQDRINLDSVFQQQSPKTSVHVL